MILDIMSVIFLSFSCSKPSYRCVNTLGIRQQRDERWKIAMLRQDETRNKGDKRAVLVDEEERIW